MTQFAPKLTSAGGNFDPNAWAQLFVDAGAKFAGPVAEHHDGFSMWNSTVNEWNSVAKGPKLDLVGQFSTAIRAKGLKFLVSSHNAYNFTGFYDHVPAQSDASLKKLYGQLGQAAEEQLWYNKLKELIDLYQPDIIWQDFNLFKISEAQRLNFLSYYYNKGIDWGKEVVATYKDGFDNKGEIYDYERGGPAGLTNPYWLTDDSISSSSWCYTQGIGYYSTKAMLHSLIDRVSKNGNMLLNIAPMADGTIPQGQKDILTGMGSWLKKYGEAIYSTRAWTKFGEGPTQMGGGSFTAPKEGTATDIRFTRSKDNTVLYAIGMGWPSNNQMVITSLKSGSYDTSKITGITFLNGGGSCTWSQDGTGLKINLPSNLADSMGYAVKISLSGSNLAGVTFYQDYDFAGSAVTLTPGNYTTAQLTAAGIANDSVSSIKVPGGMQVEVYADDNFGGTKWTFTADNANFGSAGCNDVMSSVKIINTSATPTPTPVSTATPTPGATDTPTPTGATATPTPTPTTGTPVPGGIKVQFFNGNTAATTNTIYPNFKVVNTGTATINLSDVKMRYYFTNDGTQADSFACDYSTVGAGNVTSSFTTIAKTNADRYLEVGFTSAAGTLAAGASAEVKGRVWKSDWSNFTQTGDYSFNATATNYVDAATVTGYLAGALKWGVEP